MRDSNAIARIAQRDPCPQPAVYVIMGTIEHGRGSTAVHKPEGFVTAFFCCGGKLRRLKGEVDMVIWLRLHWKKLMFVALLLGAAGFGFVRKAVEERVSSEWTEVNQELQSLLTASGQNGGTPPSSPSEGQGASAQSKDGIAAVASVTPGVAAASSPGAPTSPVPSAAVPAQASATAAPAQSPAGTNSAKGLIDINMASASRLDELPGIGPGKAKAIVEHRQEKGPFRTPEELKNVKGIGQKTYDGLKDRITASVTP